MGLLHRAAKRVFDLAGAAAGLALSAPVVAVAAAASRMEVGPPPFERQLRAGRGGEPFGQWRLRTHPHTELGAILRGSGIADLPALWNVVRGDMSLVGPRAVHPQYATLAPRRLEVRPGLTGWSQLHRGAERSWTDEQRLDDWYVTHPGLTLDVLILVRTLVDRVSARGRRERRGEEPRPSGPTRAAVMN